MATNEIVVTTREFELPVATKNIVPTDFVDNFGIAVVRSRHENYPPPRPVHPARAVPESRPLTP